MSPQAVRLSVPARRRAPVLPPRTYLVLAGTAILLLVLGRLLLPLAVLLAAGVAAILWYAPEIAYWADDELWLHRIPGFGSDHRRMAVAALVLLTGLAVLGSVAFGSVGQSAERTVAISPTVVPLPTAAMIAAPPLPDAAPSAVPTATAPPAPAPRADAPARVLIVADAPVVAAPAAAAPVAVAPAAARPAPTATVPPPRPTFTAVVAAAAPATLASTAAGRAQPTVTRSATSAPAATSPPQSEIQAEIAGVTSTAAPGGRMTLQARVTPGAACELGVQYNGGGSQSAGPQKAGDDGVCAWSWSVPPGTASGPATATVTVKQGGKSQRRSASFTVS